MRGLIAAALLGLASQAFADAPIVLKLGTVVPAGSVWAHEIDAFSHQLDTATNGQLRVKWYMGGIAGDEFQMLERVGRHQLDGIGSAGPVCARLSPTMRALGLMGLFQTHEEVVYLLSRLLPELQAETREAGFMWLAAAPVGPEVILSRTPVRDMAELRRLRLHRWDVEEVANQQGREIGLRIVPLPLSDATRAYDEGRIDAFNFPLSAALAYQATSRARYLMDLRVGFVSACLVVSNASFDRLSMGLQRALREAGAKLSVRFAMVGKRQDELLLGSILERSGITPIPVSESLRAEFFSAARTARDKVVGHAVSADSLGRVLGLLADYHAQHRE